MTDDKKIVATVETTVAATVEETTVETVEETTAETVEQTTDEAVETAISVAADTEGKNGANEQMQSQKKHFKKRWVTTAGYTYSREKTGG